MLTTRASDGHLHARAMAPAGRTSVILLTLCVRVLTFKVNSGISYSAQPSLHRQQHFSQVSRGSK